MNLANAMPVLKTTDWEVISVLHAKFSYVLQEMTVERIFQCCFWSIV